MPFAASRDSGSDTPIQAITKVPYLLLIIRQECHQTKPSYNVIFRGRRTSTHNEARGHLRRRSSRKLSVVSGSSIYYNFDSDGDEEGLESPLGEDYKANPLEMTTLAQR